MQKEIIAHYSRHADSYIARYEALPAEKIHAGWVKKIADMQALILDVGAGSGRDAAWLSDMGHRVVAVEPADGLRKKAMALHPNPSICWLNDALPDLSQVRQLKRLFDVILISAVWMHIPPADRKQTLNSIFNLLKPTGISVITLRHGSVAERPVAYPVSFANLQKLALQFDLTVLEVTQSNDWLGRTAVRWETVVMQRKR